MKSTMTHLRPRHRNEAGSAVIGIDTRIAAVKDPCDQQDGSATEAEKAHTAESKEDAGHARIPPIAWKPQGVA